MRNKCFEYLYTLPSHPILHTYKACTNSKQAINKNIHKLLNKYIYFVNYAQAQNKESIFSIGITLNYP